MVSKSPRPAPSSHWTCLLILDAGTPEPRMQRFVARSIARLMRAFTNPLTTEYGCSHFAASRSAICLSRFLASPWIRSFLWKPRIARMIGVVPNKRGVFLPLLKIVCPKRASLEQRNSKLIL
jgi:hypothetical protein